MNNDSILKLLQSNKKLNLTVTVNREPVDESGYVRYKDPVMEMDDETTRKLLKLVLTGLENRQKNS